MGNEIIGNAYKYIIDKSYGINKDGFIAIGSESIVYKGLKAKRDGGLQFSCVLKFKPKTMIINDETIDRLELFKTEEWKNFEELRECRSIVRIDDVIDDLGEFTLPCGHIAGGEINAGAYFCVVEEFIDGWSLEEFCREEYWKLRKIEPIGNGLNKIINYHEFDDKEKDAIQMSYDYGNTLKYQNQILLFMINFCEIMEFVTEQRDILHLDVKPENIMVTRHGKELVLIDFGRSKKVTKANRAAEADSYLVDYNEDETLEKMYQYGTLGYAAPECYAKAAENSKFPFPENSNQGKMTIESDIYSFGATFWECLNIFELVTKNKQFSDDAHEFYREHILNEDLYFNRDLSCSSLFYHRKLENIIKKCTRRRTENYTELDSQDYYHSYKDLRKDIENAKDSAPTIVKEENIRVRNAFALCGAMLSLFTLFVGIFFIYRLMGFRIAEDRWEELVADYNETQFYRLEEVSRELITTAPANRVDETYQKIAEHTYTDGDISEYEAAMLIGLLEQMDNPDLLPERIDEIMKEANTRRFREISTEIVRFDTVADSVGSVLANAIFNVEVGKTNPLVVGAYGVLTEHYQNAEFRNAIVKLKNVLDNDENIRIISRQTRQSRPEIQEFFRNITQMEARQ